MLPSMTTIGIQLVLLLYTKTKAVIGRGMRGGAQPLYLRLVLLLLLHNHLCLWFRMPMARSRLMLSRHDDGKQL